MLIYAVENLNYGTDLDTGYDTTSNKKPSVSDRSEGMNTILSEAKWNFHRHAHRKHERYTLIKTILSPMVDLDP